MEVSARFDDLVSRRAFELVGLSEVLVASSPDEVPGVLARVEEAVGAGGFAGGFVTYEAAPAFDVALSVQAREEPTSLPLACFALFSSRRAVAPVEPLATPLTGGWSEQWSPEEHEKAIGFIHDRIREGWTYQVNLTTRLH